MIWLCVKLGWHKQFLGEMAFSPFVVPRSVVLHATRQLSEVDYSVATKVTDAVARIVQWSYEHDSWWWLARPSIELLHVFDDAGSLLISFVVWLASHSP